MYIIYFEQKLVLFMVLCLSSAHLIAADQDRCLFHTNCTQCLAVDGCGWCDGYCLSGDTVTHSRIFLNNLFLFFVVISLR